MDVHGEPIDDLVEIPMFYAQRTQLFNVAEQLAIDIVFDFRHGWSRAAGLIFGWLEAGYDTAMSSAALEKLAWDHIDTVLLDLDGTLLDLGFDNDFWLDYVPSVYAASHALTLEQARAVLTPRFRACEGTMNWYCIDYWSRELGLDIAALKRTQAGRIAWLPGARDFLKRLRALGKRLVLLTNSHPQVLKLKDEQTGVTGYLDAAISSHVFRVPKEDPQFWKAVREVEPFDPMRSLFVDDSPAVLRAAQAAGIRWVRGVRRSSAAQGGEARTGRPVSPTRDYEASRDYEGILAVDSVSDLDPGLPSMEGRHGGLEGAGQGLAPSIHPISEDEDDSRVHLPVRQ
jgi:HAD superfamily hydrolase (TIGR01509 family)